MKPRQSLTAEALRESLAYDANTGIFSRKCPVNARHQTVKAPNGRGYLQIRVGDGRYSAHRLAWLYVYGEWPKDQIDHINGDKLDNRIVNLREATARQNAQNQKPRKTNTSGYPGVSWAAKKKKWRVRLMVGGKSISVGYFDELHKAISAKVAAKAKFHTFQPFQR